MGLREMKYNCSSCGAELPANTICSCLFSPEGIWGGKDKIISSALDKQEGGNHYKNYAIQPVEFCQKNKLTYCESNVIKYVTRHRDKNGVDDINKAIHYLELLKELEY